MAERTVSEAWRAWDDFASSAQHSPDAAALSVADKTYSYSQLHARAMQVAADIAATETLQTKPAAAIYGTRCVDSYAAILAALSRGYSYIPLNPKFPHERNRYIIDRSGASVIIGAQSDRDAIAQILNVKGDGADGPPPRTILANDQNGATPPPAIHDNPYAYIMFTSGSTGHPKGVAIRHSNLAAYLDAAFAVADFGPTDRLSQNFDLTFDLSVHDMFVAWRAGAHLIVPSEQDLGRPGPFIADNKITCWFSVPSLAQKIRMQQDLSARNLSTLRLSLFCGEALPVDLAREWAAATGQQVENWYGPTEATIAATRHVLPRDTDLIAGTNNLVPIGRPLPGMDVQIDTTGELLLIGPQLADGYLADPEKTDAAFIKHEGKRAYRTGDRVSLDADGTLQFLGRTDTQIKIRGYRVELGEIEATLRDLSGGCAAVVVPMPMNSLSPTSLVGVIEGYDKAGKVVRQAIEGILPDYMTPSRVLVMKTFPVNASGKVDRNAIAKRTQNRLEKMNQSAEPKKRKRYDRLVDFAQQVNPAIARDQIEAAENLMDAGLDSLGFVEFTLLLEKKWSLNLTQETVADLSQMSLWQMTVWLRRTLEGRDPERFEPQTGKAASGGTVKQSLHYRAMRALDFLDCFPEWLRQQADPVIPFIGSSGFMRGICPDTLKSVAEQAGVTCMPCNVGMAMLSATGIAELCDYIAQTARAQDIRFPLAVLELEVMQLTIMPPSGDIEIVQDFRSGHFDKIVRKHYDADTQWDRARAGGIPAQTATAKPTTQPNWERKRNQEIRAAFEGKIASDPKAIAAWRAGLEALETVADQVAVVIHPIQQLDPRPTRAQATPNHYKTILDTALDGKEVVLVSETDFEVTDADFKNISHMNDTQGRQNLSTQLGKILFASRL